MSYDNLCMYCFKEMGRGSICPHCGKDARAAVPQIQMLPGTPVYRDRFLLGRALGQDGSGIVYTALDTKRGGTIRIREYLPRNCAERLNDGTVVPIPGMEDAYDAGMRKLRASVDSVDDPKKRHFYFEENGTAYIAQRKNMAGGGAPMREYADDDEDAADHRKQVILYIAIAATIVLAVAIGVIWFLNSIGNTEDVTLNNPLSTSSPGATWMPAQTPTPTPYATATFAALVDPELSWMDYTYAGDVNSDYQYQVNASATQRPTVENTEDYSTINNNSSSAAVEALQKRLATLGWLDASAVNGRYDAATKQAVKDFQKYVNDYCAPSPKLAVDGIAGKKTQQWLYNASVVLNKPTPTPTPLVTPAPADTVVNENSPEIDIIALQNKLITLGIMRPGSADGKYGAETAEAVQRFQIRVNELQGYVALEVNGKVDAQTMAYLNYYIRWWEDMHQATATPSPANTPAPTVPTTQDPVEIETPAPTEDPNFIIDASSPRDKITYVQEMLEIVGLMEASGVDGVYGSGTKTAVKNFQTWVNQMRNEQTLEVTGICDPLTRTYLEYCVKNGLTIHPEITPTPEPTLPTEAPDYEPEEGEGETGTGDNTIDASSPAESISYVQEMLAEIGLLNAGDVDGAYGSKTKEAIMALQQYVNDQRGERVLEITGICDSKTLEALMYMYDRGMIIGGANQPEPTEVPDPGQQDSEITPESPRETISRMQEMLSGVGLLDAGQVDGNYGARTKEAIRALQQFVNDQQGAQILEVTGICDAQTLYYLQMSFEQGWNLEDSGDVPDPAPTEAPEATEEPVDTPTEAPAVGTITSFSVRVAGVESSGNRIELSPGKYEVVWEAEGDLAAYYLYLFDGDHELVRSAEGTDVNRFTMDTASMIPGMIYELRIGALPVNGTEADIQWQVVQMVLPEQATAEPTPEPTAEPTPKPSVSAPSINIGSSVYQQDGITYINDSTIIFSWMADGEVGSFTVNLLYEDGTNYALGTTTETSKTVTSDQLLPGLYKLYVGATPIGGSDEDTVWSELMFGVPAPEPTAAPEPDPTEAPEPEVEPTIISYLDHSSSAEDIMTVQMALYGYGLLNTDSAQQGVLDQGTLEAVAAFQQMVNEVYGAGLIVIDPATAGFIDGDTLNYLLYQGLDFNA